MLKKFFSLTSVQCSYESFKFPYDFNLMFRYETFKFPYDEYIPEITSIDLMEQLNNFLDK